MNEKPIRDRVIYLRMRYTVKQAEKKCGEKIILHGNATDMKHVCYALWVYAMRDCRDIYEKFEEECM